MKKWEAGYTSSGEFHIKPRPETPLARSKYARLIETAFASCALINPENPIAAAEAMIEAFIVLKEISNWNFKTIEDARTRARQVFLKATDRE